MDLLLVVNGNERFYCPPEQKDYWVGQGCSVFLLTPTQIAGPPIDAAADEAHETLRGVAVTITPVGEEVHAKSTMGETWATRT